MCGIAGIVDSRGGPVDEAVVRRMCQRLYHRGPDDEGYFFAPGVGLGIRRLAIIDLQTGHQPIHNEDGTIWVVLNGEIYNYEALGQQLADRGHRFYTASDTEVIVHAYEEYGEDCPLVLRGMFAFALWDSKKEQLLLVRDRVGEKPLVYAAQDGVLVFASEIAALREHPQVSTDIDWEAIHHYLVLGYVPAPATAFRAIRKLEPGHRLLWRQGEIRLSRYWTLDFTPKHPFDEDEAADRLRDLLSEAVRLRMRSDVPLGAFLSGGIDSSTVVALMNVHSPRPVKTFSIGFDVPAFTELEHARRIARHFGTDHHEFIVTPQAAEVIPTLVHHYGEPYADASAIPTYYLSRLTREHVTVALTGDGGDEMFAGYDRYRAMTVAERLPGIISLPARRMAREIRRLGLPVPHPLLARLERFALAAPLAVPLRYRSWVSALESDLHRELYTAEFSYLHKGTSAETVLGRWLVPASALALTDALLLTDTMTYLPNDLLVKVDIASMAHGLEARAPLVDHLLLEFTARLPATFKLRRMTTKYILKRAVKGLLPEATLGRRKQGFGVPLSFWLRGSLRPLMEEILLSDRAFRRGLFKPDVVRALVEEHLSGRRDRAHVLWTLMMLELWFLLCWE